MDQKLTSQAKRQELWLFSTPLGAAQASPEGWEKLSEWLGWTSNSRDQPSPSGAEQCSQDCGRGSWGTAEGPTGKEEERELSCVSQTRSSQPQRPKSAWRWSWAFCPGPRRGGLSWPHSFSALLGLRGGRQAPLSLSAQGRSPPFARGSPAGPSPRSQTLDRALGAPQSLGKLQVSWEKEEKGPRAKEAEKGRSGSVGSSGVEVGDN